MKFTWFPLPLVLCIAAVIPIASSVDSAAQPPTGRGSTQIYKQDRLVQANLPRMYEHAFRVQNIMEKQTAEQERRGVSGFAFREILRSRLGLTEEQYALFQKAALRFDPVDREIRTRLHAAAQADGAKHPRTRALSAVAMAQVGDLRASRGRAAEDEIEAIHKFLDPSAAQQLDDAVARLYSDGQAHRIGKAGHIALRTKVPGKSTQATSQVSSPRILPPPCPPRVVCVDDDDGGGDDDDDDDDGGPPPPPADPTPVITAITPSIWDAGQTQTVTITGSSFGTNAPALSFSPNAGISYTLVSYGVFQIVANVTVAPNIPTEEVEVSVTCTGYGGSGFYGGANGNSPTSQGATVQVVNNLVISSPTQN